MRMIYACRLCPKEFTSRHDGARHQIPAHGYRVGFQVLYRPEPEPVPPIKVRKPRVKKVTAEVAG
jgi:hypothetical protein